MNGDNSGHMEELADLTAQIAELCPDRERSNLAEPVERSC